MDNLLMIDLIKRQRRYLKSLSEDDILNTIAAPKGVYLVTHDHVRIIIIDADTDRSYAVYLQKTVDQFFLSRYILTFPSLCR